MAKTVREAKAKTLLDALQHLKNEIRFDRLADNLKKHEAETLGNTSKNTRQHIEECAGLVTVQHAV